MAGIFISYRRQDSQGFAGRLADTLKAQFARNQIFRDIETIEPGVDFVEAIERALASCVVLLAVIGPRWLSATDKNGRRRLDDPNDYTRIEVAAALQRNVRVIPVLVDGAVMPDPGDLPADLKTLARRQASELSDKRWDFDVQQLVQTIEKIPGIERRSEAPSHGMDDGARAPQGTARPWNSSTGLWVGAAAVVVVGIALTVWHGGREEPAPTPKDLSVPVPRDSTQTEPATAKTPAQVPQEPAKMARREAEVKRPIVSEQPPERPKSLDINGAWVDTYGNRYSVMQQDNRVAIRMAANSLGRNAEGLGTISGRRIVMDYAFLEPSIGYSRGRANVEVSSDGGAITGTYTENVSGVTVPFLLRR